MTDLELVEKAWTARAQAYTPYSQFKVGAAIETASGAVFTGCNVEIANYGCTLCAERTAIVKAVSEGHLKPGGLLRVVVAAETGKPTAPCGSCRQMIEEFACDETQIIMSNEPDKIGLSLPHRELLPYSFNSGDLNIDTRG